MYIAHVIPPDTFALFTLKFLVKARLAQVFNNDVLAFNIAEKTVGVGCAVLACAETLRDLEVVGAHRATPADKARCEVEVRL